METYERTLKLITEGKSISEIAYELKVKHTVAYKQILEIINNGLVLKKTIYDNGQIRFFKGYSEIINKTNSIEVKLTNSNKFRAVLISDTHFGNKKSNLSYLEKVYQYCDEEKIHVIINGGDLIDGRSNHPEKDLQTPKQQLEYILQNHPYSNNIINLICLGNHDYQLFDYAIDIKKRLLHERADLIPLGYGQCIINIGKDQLFIKHPINMINPIDSKGKLTLCGHSHICKFNLASNIINIPSLSDLNFNEYIPSFIDMNLILENGKIINGSFKNLTVENEIKKISEICTNITTNDETIEIETPQKLSILNNPLENKIVNSPIKRQNIKQLKKKRR